MKKLILTSTAVLFIGLTAFPQYYSATSVKYDPGASAKKDITGSSRDLKYQVHGKYSRTIKDEKLKDARLISDIIDGYPVNWITNYISVEILATRGGKTIKTLSSNNTLSPEQKNILAAVENK